ncbi:hypothetical protein ACFOWE_31350 [Planomonospora corallina]|uniref:Uncharacterized protein n=1 Tax=Planomonospora corallina TaxID=1806052 RepID=A0ABV8IFZ3_9ACTN
MSASCVAIDDTADPPEWVRKYLSPEQLLHLNPGLLWILLIYQHDGLESSRINVAQRLHVHTLGKVRKEAKPSFKALATDLCLSERTVEPAVEDLERDGWIIVVRVRNKTNVYRLAWPLEDPLAASVKKADQCGELTSKSGMCTRRAGWGTNTPGVGPCKLHGGTPSSPEPQPLRSEPVDNSEHEPPSTATVADLDRNGCSLGPQPLQPRTATVADEYVKSALGSALKSSLPPSPVRAAGALTRRNAREAPAPAAQPGDEFTARSLVAAIGSRYRGAPPWVRRHLTGLVAQALARGFGRDAVVAYARMVIAEHAFKDHQHIPEMREALRRLGRDVALGDACPEHGACECTRCAPHAPDRPWTDGDQAEWEAALAHFGVSADDLDQATS